MKNRIAIMLTSLIAAMLVFPSTVLYKTADAAECNCVVFRLDDIQDEWLNSVQVYVMDVFIDRNHRLTLGEVMNFFGSDELVLDKTIEGGNSGLFEYAVHGWNHDDYTAFNLNKQQSELQKANDKMQALYGKKSNVFITPFNEFNSNTLTAMKNLNIRIISAATYSEYYDDHPSTPLAPAADSNGIYHAPETASFSDYIDDVHYWTTYDQIMSAINSSIEERGWAVVTIHPQDFSDYEADGVTVINSVNQTSIARLNAVLDTINESGYSIISYQQLVGTIPVPDTSPPDTTITSAVDGFGIPVINNGVTASNTMNISFTGSDNVAVASFQANRDNAGWTAAASPLQLTGLGLGGHTVQIRSVDTSGLVDPTPASFSWTVILPNTTPPTVTASPPGGSYSSAQSVTLTANEPATIYYTTNGSTPTTSSPVYSSPISISTTTTLKFFGRDAAGNSSPVSTQVYTIGPATFPATHMSDTTQTYGLHLYSAQQAHVEFVSSSSQLVGKSIDQITLKIRKTGAPTGTAQIGVFNADLTVKKLFGTKDATTITSTYTDYTFSLSGNELYTIQPGDRIGIRFTGGNSNNYAAVMLDRNSADPFDGGNTYRQQYNTSWGSYPVDDMYMILRQTHA